MSTYNPDRWLIVKVTPIAGEVYHKIFGSFMGGYLTSDEWRFSSPIAIIQDQGDLYSFDTQSGSTYLCYKGMYGSSLYATSVLYNMVEAAKKLDMKIKPLMESGAMKYIKALKETSE